MEGLLNSYAATAITCRQWMRIGVVKPVLMIKEAAQEGLASPTSVACVERMRCCAEKFVGAWQMKTVRICTTQTLLMTAVTMRFNCVKYKDFIKTAVPLRVSR